jgi:hypothetical protein
MHDLGSNYISFIVQLWQCLIFSSFAQKTVHQRFAIIFNQKVAHKMLVKLILLVNSTYILGAAFALIIFYYKITKSNCKQRKVAQNTFTQKTCSLNDGEINSCYFTFTFLVLLYTPQFASLVIGCLI